MRLWIALAMRARLKPREQRVGRIPLTTARAAALRAVASADVARRKMPTRARNAGEIGLQSQRHSSGS